MGAWRSELVIVIDRVQDVHMWEASHLREDCRFPALLKKLSHSPPHATPAHEVVAAPALL